MEEEIAEEQCGFVPGKETQDQILNLKVIIEKNRERRKNLYLCSMDYRKVFDTAVQEVLWKNMIGMGSPKHVVLHIKLCMKTLILHGIRRCNVVYNMTTLSVNFLMLICVHCAHGSIESLQGHS